VKLLLNGFFSFRDFGGFGTADWIFFLFSVSVCILE
jgi:hypothetical protein